MEKAKKVFRISASVLIFCVIFLFLQRLLMPKYASGIPEGNFTAEYYKETTKHDVIMIGDCEVYENINPMYLWKQFGITSYIRGNAQQLTWQSYYMLEDTLRYETPKAVIYNIQALVHAEPQREEYNRMTLDGMRWSKTKWNAIRASMCEEEQMLFYIFPLFRYHDRIFELEKQDISYFFRQKKSAHNGYYMRIDVLPASESDVADTSWIFGNEEAEQTEIIDPWAEIEETETTEEKNSGQDDGDYIFGAMPMEYLEKIRVLCEENGITLILMKAPSLAPQWHEQENQQVEEYAKKNQLCYINFYDLIGELGIDYETDTYDGGLHMNLSGADKMSEYLGDILQTEFKIPDHREDAELAAVYEKKYDYFEKMKKKQEEDLKKYGEVLD